MAYSMPRWILEQWLSVYSLEQVERMLQDFLQEKPTSIRCNLHQISRKELKEKLTREGVKAEEVPELPCALLISAVMFGASFLKLIGFGLSFTAKEAGLLLLGCVVSFGVSVLAIKFLMGYIKNHDFKVFGYYRVILGAIIIVAAVVQMIIA